MAIIGLADRGQYTGVKITRLTETEVNFTTPDGTFGVRLADRSDLSFYDNRSRAIFPDLARFRVLAAL